jgi:hypothetical protein
VLKGDIVVRVTDSELSRAELSQGGPKGYRRLSEAERDAWAVEFRNNWLTSDGETRVPPRLRAVRIDPEGHYLVLQARTAQPEGKTRYAGGFMTILDTVTGYEIVVARKFMRRVT